MALALGAGGLVKGATGMGLPLIALPILTAFLGIQHAVALICLPVAVTNIWQVWRFRAAMWEGYFLPAMLISGIGGVAVGTWLIVSAPERALSLTLAILVFVYIGLRLGNPNFIVTRRWGKRLAPIFGFAAGALQGATGISSPVGVTFIHAMRLGRAAHVFAVSAMFLLYTCVQVPALVIAGVLTWQIALEGLIAIIPAFLTMPVGNWLASRASQATFDRIVMALLAALALELAWSSIAG
jgi:uncharacterized membrane protein YfcA